MNGGNPLIIFSGHIKQFIIVFLVSAFGVLFIKIPSLCQQFNVVE